VGVEASRAGAAFANTNGDALMHDGRFATLRDVIEHHDHGVRDSPLPDPIRRTVLPPPGGAGR
jgi:hypothetical protein